MIDPLNDQTPRWTSKTVLAFAGWVAASAFAVAGLRDEDKRLAAALDGHQAKQVLIDQGQTARIDKLEAEQSRQRDLLFDICAAVQCRGKAKRMDDGNG